MPRYTTSPSYQNIFYQSKDHNLPLSVHDLPPEIVGIIFTMLDETYLQPSDAGMPPVLTVSRTCRRWRQISLSLPSLWSFIGIHLRESDHHITLLTRLFVGRSQKHPLRLILHFRRIDSLDGKEDTVISILRTLVQHSERWHTVEFRSVRRTVMSHQVLSPLSGPLPMLDNLTLRVRDRVEDLDLDISFDPFSNCPSLTRVSWEPGVGPLRNQRPFAWGRLRMIDIYFMEISDAFRLATLGSVEQLALYHCRGDLSGHLALPSVTHLTIDAMVPEEAYCPLEWLTLQRLSSLDIFYAFRGGEDWEDWEDWDEKPILDFLDRSGCTVTSLSLRGIPISDEQLIQLLQLMPALSSLRLEEFLDNWPVNTNRTVTRRFLQELTINNMSSPFLPRLTDISLTLHEDELVDTMLPTALISRCFPDGSQSEVASIKSVDIGFIEPQSEEPIQGLLSRLWLLKERGVRVTVGRVSWY